LVETLCQDAKNAFSVIKATVITSAATWRATFQYSIVLTMEMT